MQQTHRPPAPPTLRELDIGYHINHYARLFWRWKWWIAIAAPVLMSGWIIYVVKIGFSRPPLDATIMVGLENTTNATAVQDIGKTGYGKVELMRSANFLTDVVSALSLRLVVSGMMRHEVFDSVFVDSVAGLGRYVFNLDKEDKKYYTISFSNRRVGHTNKVIKRDRLVTLDTVSLPGIHLKFASSFLKDPRKVAFYVTRTRDAVDNIRKNIHMSGDPIKDGFVMVSLTGIDYPLITKTINSLADAFVEKNLNFRKRKTVEVISVLGKQLETASRQLSLTEGSVRNFRESNSSVGLRQDVQSTVQTLATLESGSYELRTLLEETKAMEAKYQTSTGDDRQLAISEILIYLISHDVAAAVALQSDFTQYMQQHASLIAAYSPTHPQVTAHSQKLAAIGDKASQLLSDFIENIWRQLNEKNNNVESLTAQIKRLPSQELRLAELERNQQTSSQIHAMVLGRYNQARIADAVEMADVFIMDYAYTPELGGGGDKSFQMLLIGLGIALVFVIGLPVLFDLIDKTAHTEQELKRLLDIIVIESIPEIKPDTPKKRTRKKRPAKNEIFLPSGEPIQLIREIDPMLITADFAPNYVNELFRSMRAKILLLLAEMPDKRIAITSLNMSEGKSLIAANLAITIAQQKVKTLLIDGDMRRGVLHNMFLLQKKPGLSTLLLDDQLGDEAAVRGCIQNTHVPNLHLIASGANIPNPSELLSSPRMADLFAFLSREFGMIIFDTPPLGVSADAALVGELMARYVVVVKAGSTNLVDLRRKLTEYSIVRNKIQGLVLNRAAIDRKLKYYKYSHYNY